MAYTVKEVNSVAGCSVFTVAALCSHATCHSVQDIWTKAFVNTDVMFVATKPSHNCGKYGHF